MTFQQLSFVVEVANCESINKAAERLYTSQSNVSNSIKALEEEFNDMPIEKAGRLFVQLIKADADRKRTDYITKRKAELALDQMEADLLAQIRQYPDLTSQLKDVLNQARTRIIGSELE